MGSIKGKGVPVVHGEENVGGSRPLGSVLVLFGALPLLWRALLIIFRELEAGRNDVLRHLLLIPECVGIVRVLI